MDKYGLTIEEAASYTGIGRDTLRKLADGKSFPYCGLEESQSF